VEKLIRDSPTGNAGGTEYQRVILGRHLGLILNTIRKFLCKRIVYNINVEAKR
jgi:hypothetical protein